MEYSAEVRGSLERLLSSCLAVAQREGIHSTPVPYLEIVRREAPSPPRAGILKPAFCLVLQGCKVVSWGRNRIPCGPGRFLASTFERPAYIHVEDATPDHPYIGLVIHLEATELAGVIMETNVHPTPPSSEEPQQYIGEPFPNFLPILERIVSLGGTPEELNWSLLLKKNLMYALLTSPVGHLFVPAGRYDMTSRIPEIAAWIRRHFQKPLVLAEVADRFSMSISSLHHRFKAFTGQSPVQFQKLLRLQQARRLLLAGQHDVTRAAFEVGYSSLSHFGRDYARIFGISPGKDVRTYRLTPSDVEGSLT